MKSQPVRKVLLVDNYDSFTFNLKQLLLSFTPDVEVVPNDDASLKERKDFSHLILSPGPGDPSYSGYCPDLVRKWAGKKPLLGVCLGHQIIADVFGGKVVKAPLPMHGKVSEISHNGEELFYGLKPKLKIARYHSLMVEPRSLPSGFQVSALCDSIIMALSHKAYPGLYGVQFHPESFLSEGGETMVKNFLNTLGEMV